MARFPHDPVDPAAQAVLDNVRIVLSHTTEPRNVGATARAIKTMGLSRLVLISPHDPYGERARALAHGAEDVLDGAQVVLDHRAAVRDCLVVAGTTARPRELRKGALMAPHELASLLIEHAAEGPVALMFGTERTGLTNDEVYACRYVCSIDTAPEQPSLNLSQAVMVMSYELRRAWRAACATPRREPSRRPEMRVNHPHRSTKLPTQDELDVMYEHLGAAMAAVGLEPPEREKFLTYMRHLHMRAGIVNWELQIYHLFASKVLHATGAEPYRKGER